MKIKILNKDNLIIPDLSIGSRYALSNLKEYETTDGEVYRKNFNETLDSGVIVLTNLTERINIEPYDEIILSDSYSGKNMSIFANKEYRMLVDNFTETMVSVEPKIYRYDINLFSKTKLLEGAICPNLSITPLRVVTKRSIYHYIQQYMNLYCPKKRVRDGGVTTIKPIISLSSKLASKFSDSCPELQWNTPTLREVLNDLFILKDCVAIVNANNELDYLDLTEIKNNIKAYDGINYIQRSQSSQDYVSEIYMNMVNVMNTSVDNVRNTVNTSEYIPFNATNYVATSENIILKTRFPIQRIKHLYMVQIVDIETEYAVSQTPLIHNYSRQPIVHKVDLMQLSYRKSSIDYNGDDKLNVLRGNFVKEKADYDSLKIAYRINDMSDNLDEYQNCCLYYSRYGDEIRGFSNETKNAPFLFFDTGVESTIVLLKKLSSNSVDLPGGKSYYYNVRVDDEKNQYSSVFFQIDYETTTDAVFKASKNAKQSNSRTIIDNQPYSFVDGYTQGFLEYQKANRLGNQVMMINQRVNADLSNQSLIDIGDYYEDENGDRFIVYNVEYQNNRHHIEVNAQATKDYVLKNYFTGVKQKIRTWVNAQDEAHIRNEHAKVQIQLNLTQKKDEDISKFGWLSFFDKKLIASGITNDNTKVSDIVSLTSYKDSSEKTICLPRTDDYYYNDSMYRIMGNSIVATTGFIDNYSVGKGIDLSETGDIDFKFYPGSIDFPRPMKLDKITEFGGVPLSNNFYTNNDGEFDSIDFYFGKQHEVQTNILGQFTNCKISQIREDIGAYVLEIDNDLISSYETTAKKKLKDAIDGGYAYVYVNNKEYILRGSDSFYFNKGAGDNYSIGTRCTIYPLYIYADVNNKQLFDEFNKFIKPFYNFPKLAKNNFTVSAHYQNNCYKDNKDIFRQNIQIEYISKNENLYFTSKFLERNNLVVLNKKPIRIYSSDTYLKDSKVLPEKKLQISDASISVNNTTGEIKINNVAGTKAYYITDDLDNVILATNKITTFYINIRCILNDNVYNTDGIIIDTL